jgi:hypothetical protein
MFGKTLDQQYDHYNNLNSTLKKVRSVDFTRSRLPSVRNDGSAVASQFSRRAARGSYSRLYTEASCSNYDPLRPEEGRIKARADDVPKQETRLVIPLTLGKLSVIILLVATIIDFCVCQVHRIESPELYDALSTEVIRPAFSYHVNKHQRSSLGSAAISSVTEALSPILPFTGGLDLRREDYCNSSGNWFETIQSVATQVQDAFSSRGETVESKNTVDSIPRGGGNVPGKLSKAKSQHAPLLSAQQPFVSLEAIADLTLRDVSETFRYAMECNKEGFNEARFINGLAPRVRTVVTAMSEAIAKSRGKDVKMSIAKVPKVGEVDALAFAAAMRIFAEWRVLRQVPEGYKGYAVA